MKPGDFCIARFPFGDRAGVKMRPVLVLSPLVGLVPEVLVAYVSTAAPASPLPTDIEIDPALPEFASTGMASRSVVRLHKLATVHGRAVGRRVGEVSPALAGEVADKLRSFLNL